jgi:hypothetical protein
VNNQPSISKIPTPRESIINGKCARSVAIGADMREALTTFCAKQSQFVKGQNSEYRRLNGTDVGISNIEQGMSNAEVNLGAFVSWWQI